MVSVYPFFFNLFYVAVLLTGFMEGKTSSVLLGAGGSHLES
jgi:hypothetical protein